MFGALDIRIVAVRKKENITGKKEELEQQSLKKKLYPKRNAISDQYKTQACVTIRWG